MPRPRKNQRSIEDIMAAEIINAFGEAQRKYPNSSASHLYRLEREKRIRLFGSPKKLRCSHYEAQMEKGFPVLEDTDR